MSDQEITDRDETRRLLYIALATRYPVDGKIAELIGTAAHALTHHATNGNAAEGLVNLSALAELVGSKPSADDGPAVWTKRVINRLSDEIDQLKQPATESPRGVLAKDAAPDNPRRAFLHAVKVALDRVANDPDGQWFTSETSGDTMHGIEVALDRYLTAAPSSGSLAEVDLAQALDMLRRILGYFNETGHPGFEAVRTGWHETGQVRQWVSWVGEARARQAGRTQ